MNTIVNEPLHSLRTKNMRTAYNENILLATLGPENEHSIDNFMHSHNEYEIIIPYSPIPCLLRENSVCFGEVGKCYPVPSGYVHGIKTSLKYASYLNILINKEYFESLQDKLWIGTDFANRFRFSEQLKNYVDMFYGIFNSSSKFKKHMLDSAAELLCAECIDLEINHDDVSGPETRHYQKGIEAACDYIHNNFKESITVDNLAELCGLSKFYFIRTFSSHTGVTPIAYLNKFRISRAKFLLQHTELSIAEIAAECGFHSTGNFTSLFRKYTGITPSEFR